VGCPVGTLEQQVVRFGIGETSDVLKTLEVREVSLSAEPLWRSMNRRGCGHSASWNAAEGIPDRLLGTTNCLWPGGLPTCTEQFLHRGAHFGSLRVANQVVQLVRVGLMVVEFDPLGTSAPFGVAESRGANAAAHHRSLVLGARSPAPNAMHDLREGGFLPRTVRIVQQRTEAGPFKLLGAWQPAELGQGRVEIDQFRQSARRAARRLHPRRGKDHRHPGRLFVNR